MIKKSSSKQPAHVLNKEKVELISKARSKKKNLIEWKPKDLEKISNNTEYYLRKSIVNKFNGYLKTLEHDRIVSFARIDRGSMNYTSRMIAVTSDLEIYYTQSKDEVLVELNGSPLGKIVDHRTLFDRMDQEIGFMNRNQTESPFYEVTIKDKKCALVLKNSDRRPFTQNRRFEQYSNDLFERDPFDDADVVNSNLIKLFQNPNEDEYQWLTAIVLYEAIHYGADFTY